MRVKSYLVPLSMVGIAVLSGCSGNVDDSTQSSREGFSASSAKTHEPSKTATSKPKKTETPKPKNTESPKPVKTEASKPAPLVNESAIPTQTVSPTPPESTPVSHPDKVAPKEEPKVESSKEAVDAITLPEEENPGIAKKSAPAPVTTPITGGTSYSLTAGGSSVDISTPSGQGTVVVHASKIAGSAAPNYPLYVSATCDGVSTFSGAVNVTEGGAQELVVPYSGSSCRVFARLAQPSNKWTGTYGGATLKVSQPIPTANASSNAVMVDAPWVSQVVTGVSNFSVPVPAGFRGTINLKLTSCTSAGGSSDATVSKACAPFVNPNSASALVNVSSGSQNVFQAPVTITANEHHKMLSIPVKNPTQGAVNIQVTPTGGSYVLVHGPGTKAVGSN